MPELSDEDPIQSRLALLDRLRQSEIRATGSRVAAVVGHLIGTPLNVIAGRASLIRSNPAPQEAVQNALKIEEQVTKLTQRIRRLIEYLNPTEPAPKRTLMSEVVADALALYGPIAELAGVRIELDAETVADKSVQDGASALVVLTALIALAIRVAPRGKVIALNCTTTATEGSFELDVPGLTIPRGRIDVMEPPDEADPAGAPHLQVLAVCSSIARRAGGELQVRAIEPGRGSMRLTCSLSFSTRPSLG